MDSSEGTMSLDSKGESSAVHNQERHQISGPNIMSRMALNDNKAGMEGLDKERINQIIYEASKDSKFYENEKKKEEQLEIRIREQQSKLSKITKTQLLAAEREASKMLAMLEDERDLSHTIVHVDMDAFYAAVEMRDNPSLCNKPMAVGGMGMLSTSNYLARRFGVRAAMPGFIGLKLCPDLIMVKPNFDKYQCVSREIRDVMSQYDPDFCPMSLDEAYLDLTNHMQQRQSSSSLSRMFLCRSTAAESCEGACGCDLNSTIRPKLLTNDKLRLKVQGLSDEALQAYLAENDNIGSRISTCDSCGKDTPSYVFKVYGRSVDEAVLELRNRIEQRTRLTASAGIAPNTMLAKVCSDKNKPNGQYQIKPCKTDVMNFIRDLPIRKISGIGKVTEKLLGSLGVVTCNDLLTQKATLYHLFSPTSFHHFMHIAAGIGSTSVERDGERKSISTERTFSEISSPALLMEKCQNLCQSLSEDMKDDGVLGKTLTIKVKTVSFEVKTRSVTLTHPANDETTLLRAAQALLQTEIEAVLPQPLRLRLMGVRMSKLSNDDVDQVSVANMFKKINDKEKNKSQAQPALPSMDLSEQRSDAVEFSEGCSFMPHAEKLAGEDSEDEESDEFRLPLESAEGTLHASSPQQSAKPNLSQTLNAKEESRIVSKGNNASILRFVKHPESSHKGNGSTASVSAAASLVKIDSKQSAVTLSCETKDIQAIQLSKQNSSYQGNSALNFTSACERSQDSKTACTSLDSNQATAYEDVKRRMVSCPICRQQKLDWPLDQLNTHIDLCLSKQTVKEILQNEKTLNSGPLSQPENKSKRVASSISVSRYSADKRRKTQPSVISYFKS